MLRRLSPDQPETFAFTPANREWAEAQMTKYPEGRQASAIIALLWRAQEQEGWLTRPAIEHVADMLGLAYIRALEVATFYFMFQLQPVGKTAHIQICGTTSCMICGAEDLVAVCREKIAPRPHEVSADGQLSWEEVECLGACSNAPMAQIGKDYYEDLTAARLGEILDELRQGAVPVPGPQNGRFASEPLGGATTLTDHAEDKDHEHNVSVAQALAIGDTIRRIDGTEVPLRTPWHRAEAADLDPKTAARDPMLGPSGPDGKQAGKVRGEDDANRERGDASDAVANVRGSDAEAKGRPDEGEVAPGLPGDAAEGIGEGARPVVTGGSVDADGQPDGQRTATEVRATSESVGAGAGTRPAGLAQPRAGRGDDLKRLRGVGPRLENMLNSMGFWHFDQIAAWSDAEIAWVDSNLEGFKGRVTRDEWVKQAKVLADGGETDTSARDT
ncbi:NADH-quinone oxidoreductase subunit E [Jannaschia rubra]|uniref:NADH-quinone oxidoreductase chain 2 n=1 Tax=Jannaschia rubra TaxID=282197 RepID=A0A0M6XTL1_9RHOB|nr:NADH-quinone oxidoreductase subunit E [Jannaschia rubra]CTQ33571.1 NADH-quinone oxidoreductase chain 2 [Jannaschia rubra]SFG04103.1 NADH dehydrogenase subunit E [Jannaschia rubra]